MDALNTSKATSGDCPGCGEHSFLMPLQRRRCGRRVQQVSILGSEKKNEAVHEAKKLAEEVRQRQLAGPHPLAQGAILGVTQKPVPEAQSGCRGREIG